MSAPIRVISSMATKEILAALAERFEQKTGFKITLESVGGVDAAKRVEAGEIFDVVVLAANAIEKLGLADKVLAHSRRDLTRSGVAVAVQAGTAHPDLSNETAVKAAVLAAPTVGYSTGPSGVQLARQFERWGIVETLQSRIVIAPAGVAVGSLVAKGEVALGFQQLSELIHQEGIDIVGPLPHDIQIITTFTAAVARSSTQVDAAAQLIAFMASAETADIKREQGMEPV